MPVPHNLVRFEQSMKITYEKWHDGGGYDLEALQSSSPEERQAIEGLLVKRGASDWRDVEALALIDTPHARQILTKAMREGNAEIRAAVLKYSPGLIPDTERIASIVEALRTAIFGQGLAETLALVTRHHPQEVLDSLFLGALNRGKGVGVHFAAMLFFLYGKASEPFDWKHRPFFLRFHSEDRRERTDAFKELCQALGVAPEKYLAQQE